MPRKPTLRELLRQIRLEEFRKPPFKVTATDLPQDCLDKLQAWAGRIVICAKSQK